jgi:hypothetical protein
MKDLIKNHIFWKFGLVKNSLFTEDVSILYDRTRRTIDLTYVFFLLVLFTYFFNGISSNESLMYNPLWAVSFLSDIPSNQLYLFFHTCLFANTLVVILFSKIRFTKVSLFLIYFLYVAFVNSFGKINHSNHLVLMVLFCFALLPSARTKNFREKTILIFASAQVFLLTAYFLTGFWKLFWGVIELLQNKISLFSPLSLRNVLIVQFEQTDITVLGEFFIEHYTLGWILYLVIVYIEFSSILIFFKPNLHRLWGVLLLMLHYGTYALLGVNMFTAPFYIGILLLLSPFATTTDFKSTFKSLPIFSLFFNKNYI